MEGKIPVKTNIDQLISRIGAKSKKIKKAMPNGVVLGMRFFQGMIERTQMSGRPGLKTQTANLKRSGKLTRSYNAYDFIVKVGWYAKYAMIHQKGGVIKPRTKNWLQFRIGNEWIKTKSVTIPKRLWVFEQFKNRGERMVFRSIQDELRKAIA